MPYLYDKEMTTQNFEKAGRDFPGKNQKLISLIQLQDSTRLMLALGSALARKSASSGGGPKPTGAM